MSYYYEWKPYVSVAQRRRTAKKEMEQLRKRGVDIQPVEIEGRKIATTFWGKAWCDHMEAQGDFANRLPRGRTYVRNGSVCHLAIKRGRIEAKVSGSEIYEVSITIDVLPKQTWQQVQQQCRGRIGSLMELLTGKISAGVMEVVTDRRQGLFPSPKEIELSCDCPDYATMCKHAAAVLYGVGARLDHQPELLFLLRGVDHLELIAPAEDAVAEATGRGSGRRQVAADDLGAVFGIDLEPEADPPTSTPAKRAKQKKASAKKPPRRAKKTSKRAAARPGKSEAAEDIDARPKKVAKTKKAVKRKTSGKKATKKTNQKATPKKPAASVAADSRRGKQEGASTTKRAAKKKASKKKTAKQATVRKAK